MTKMKNAVRVMFAVLAFAFSAVAQSTITLTATKLAAAITSTSQTQIQLASATGVVATSTILYLEDGYGGNPEAVFVNAVQGTLISVTRGYSSTLVQPHLSGTFVLVGSPSQFANVDPSGACTAAAAVTPTVSLQTGRQWICSSILGQWVPGFFNDVKNSGVSASVAAAAGPVNPPGPLFHITGSVLAITAWGSSTTAGLTTGGGGSTTAPAGASFCIIPDVAFTTTAGNNIALGSTAVVNKLLCYTYDTTNHKYVPSY